MRSTAVSIGDTATADQYDKLRLDAFGAAFLLPHEQSSPNMTVYVEPGVAYVGATRVIYAGGNSPTITNPVSNPRIDLITIDSSGTIGVTAGSENASPTAPTYPANKLVLAEIYLRTTGTTIRDSDQGSSHYIKNDVRPFLGGAYIASNSQVATGAAIQPSKLDSGNVDADWLPDADNTRKLGSSSRRWSELRAALLYGDGSNLTGLSTVQLVSSFTAGESITAGQPLAFGGGQSDGGVLYDSQTSGSGSSGSTIGGPSFSVANNPNRILLCVIVIRGLTGGQSVNTPTYNGVSFTNLYQASSIFGDNCWVGYLKAPATGSNTFACTFSGSCTYAYSLYSYYNVDQTSPIDSSATSGEQLGTNSGSANLTPSVDGCLVWSSWIQTYQSAPSRTVTVGTNNATGSVGGSTSRLQAGDHGQLLPAASCTASYSGSGGGNYHDDLFLVSLTPAASVTYGFVYKATANPAAGKSNLYKAFAGFAAETKTLGQAIKVVTTGVVTGLSSLTPNTQYFLANTAGTIATSAGSNSRKIGISIDATSLLITNIW